jgi:hypothetical protein
LDINDPTVFIFGCVLPQHAALLVSCSAVQGLPNEVQFGEETRRELPVGVVYRLETWNYEEVRIIYAIYLYINIH